MATTNITVEKIDNGFLITSTAFTGQDVYDMHGGYTPPKLTKNFAQDAAEVGGVVSNILNATFNA